MIASRGLSNTRCIATVSSTTPEVGAEMPTGPRDGGDQHLADLRAEAGEVFWSEPTQVLRSGDLLEQHKVSLVEARRLGADA